MEYTIKNEYLNLVVSSAGAEKQKLTSSKGIEYLRTRDHHWNRIAPFLFPIVGKLRDSKTIINGQKYFMNQHGFLRDQEFEVVEQKTNEITLQSQYNKETLKLYPFKYQVMVNYKIEAKTLRTTLTVKNLSDEAIPFNIGGHPGFKVPLYDNESFEDYHVIFEFEETFNAPKVVLENGTLNFDDTVHYENLKDLKLKYDYFLEDAIVIKDIKSKSVLLVNENNKGIRFDFPFFTTLAIWTKPNAPFVCLEPWNGYADKYNSNYKFVEKDNIITISKDEEYKVEYDITILE